MSHSSRMMIYTQDSFGLGHLRRTSHLANQLVSKRKDLTILMVVDSPVAPFFPLAERIDFVKLPTIVKMEAGVFRAGRLDVEYSKVHSIRTQMILGLLEHFDPRLVLVDHMAGGANNELLPALRMNAGTSSRAKFVLGLRDIIDDPVVTCALWQKEKVYETINDYYDSVLIYGCKQCFPTADHYQLAQLVQRDVHYCGYVCHAELSETKEMMQKKLSFPSNLPVITLVVGGGSDASRLIALFLDALEMGLSDLPFHAVIVTGPFLPESFFLNVKERAERLGVTMHKSLRDTVSQIQASDLVITMAGYNTLSEILRLKKRALVLPRTGPSKEQGMRAGIFSERGLIKMLDPVNCSGLTLLKEIMEMIGREDLPKIDALPDMSGVENASNLLLSLLD